MKDGLGLPGGDQIAQGPVVPLHRAWPVPIFWPLNQQLAVVERHLALLRACPAPSRVLGQEHTHHAEVAGEADGVDQPVQREVGVLVSLRVVRLVADALAAAVGARARGLASLTTSDGVCFGVVDRDGADLLGQRSRSGGGGHPDRPAPLSSAE